MSIFAETMMFNSKNGNPWRDAKGSVAINGLATSSEAIKASGLDWNVAVKPAYVNSGKFSQVKGTNFMVRDSDNKVLGTVGDRYVPLQNSEAFGFFDDIVGADEALFETAGSFREGQRIWLQAKMPDFIRIGKTDDLIEKYVLLTNSHDGKSTVTVKITPIRVLCLNSLNVALKGHGDEYRVRHTTNMADRLKEAQNVMGFTNLLYRELDLAFNSMASVKMNTESMDEYFKGIFGETNKSKTIIDEVCQTMEEGAGVDDPLLRHTLYHVYNSVTEWVDHVKTYNKGTDKLEAISFGSGATIKKKAMEHAMVLV